jgi:hypothetical protein
MTVKIERDADVRVSKALLCAIFGMNAARQHVSCMRVPSKFRLLA